METLYFFYLCSCFTSFKVSFLFGDLTVEILLYSQLPGWTGSGRSIAEGQSRVRGQAEVAEG